MSQNEPDSALSKLYAMVFEQSGEAIMITDKDDRVVLVNEAFRELTGYELSEIKGQLPDFLQSGEHSPGFFEEMWKIVHDTGYWKGEVGHRNKNGEVLPNWLSITAVRDDTTGDITNYISIFSDFTSEKAQREHLLRLAQHDFLTGLPNRVLLYDRFDQVVKTQKRNKQQFIGVLFVDLDEFKPVNDTYGHKLGDRILKQVAKRLIGSARESDTVCRLGGDEFVLLLPALTGVADAESIAKKVLQALAREFDMGTVKVSISASIGVSMYPKNGKTVEDLILLADKAMYKAKGSGKNSYCVYS